MCRRRNFDIRSIVYRFADSKNYRLRHYDNHRHDNHHHENHFQRHQFHHVSILSNHDYFLTKYSFAHYFFSPQNKHEIEIDYFDLNNRLVENHLIERHQFDNRFQLNCCFVKKKLIKLIKLRIVRVSICCNLFNDDELRLL